MIQKEKEKPVYLNAPFAPKDAAKVKRVAAMRGRSAGKEIARIVMKSIRNIKA